MILPLVAQLQAVGLPEPEVEVRFWQGRRWRFDLAWDNRIAVEIQGGGFVRGRHSRGKGLENDCEKFSEAALRGWLLLIVTPAMIADGRALELIRRAFALRTAENEEVSHG